MSFDALAWAAKQRTGSSGTKLVLLGLAECADRVTAEAFPSVAALVEFSDLNRKSVIVNLDRLEAGGFIKSTGGKVGRTGQIKVYQLQLGTVPKAEQFQKRNSTVSSVKQSQKRNTDTVREPVKVQKATPSSPRAQVKPFRLPDDWKPTRFADDTVARDVINRRGREWGRAALESFRNWAANAEDKDGKGRKVDWQRAWGNWVIEQDTRNGRQTNGMGGNRGQSASGRGTTVDAAQGWLAGRRVAANC